MHIIFFAKDITQELTGIKFGLGLNFYKLDKGLSVILEIGFVVTVIFGMNICWNPKCTHYD